MEAMAAELPVVAVNATGTSDAVDHGIQGLLTENDSEALGQAIHQVLEDNTLLTRLKEGAIKKARSFDMMAQAQKTVDVYQQAIEDKRANRYINVDIDSFKAKMIEKDRR
jgi:glycosyltransferase involved in cell wall biosynthesis